MRINLKEVSCKIVLFLVILASMNFKGKSYYFFLTAFLLLLLFQKRIKINKIFFVYVLLSLLLAVYNFEAGIMTMITFFSIPALYLVGLNFPNYGKIHFEDLETQREKIIKWGYYLLLSVVIGSLVHFMLNFLINFGQSLGRNTLDVWTGEVMSATIQASLACIGIGFAVAMILSFPQKKKKILGVFIVFCIFAYNLTLAGRTLIVIFGLVFVCGVIYLLYNTQSFSKKIKILLGIGVLLVLIGIMYMSNFAGIKDFIMDSNLFVRFTGESLNGLTESQRSDAKMLYLENLWKYPFGGLHMRMQFGYAHDLLLDAYDEYGFISTIFLVLIIYDGIKNFYKFCRNKNYNISYRMSFFCIYISILLEFFVEPIFAGALWLFVCYCLINGCIKAANDFVYNN